MTNETQIQVRTQVDEPSTKFFSSYKVENSSIIARMAVNETASNRSFGGYQNVYEHDSAACNCKMTFGVYFPPQAETKKCPVLYYLSGLTCTEQNVITKGNTQMHAAKHGIIIVTPDTSPRGSNIEGEHDSYDFGSGAGFYVDATEEKWKWNYRMYSYVTKELPNVVNNAFSAKVDENRMSVFGHSMGGHGALVCALKNPGQYKSVSAFAPITNPMNCDWGRKAFQGYLGADEESHKAYDSCELARSYQGPNPNMMIDQGTKDQFLYQLLPENMEAACKEGNIPLKLRLQEGYDHSYFFMSTFMEDHVQHHAEFLCDEKASL